MRVLSWALALWAVGGLTGGGCAQSVRFSRPEMERLLLEGKVAASRNAPGGITGSRRATLRLGDLTHDAHIQTIDESKIGADLPRGVELKFRDTWKFNVAAYKLDQLLGLNMVPVTVERTYAGWTGSFTWWVDNVLMDEAERRARKQEPPDLGRWNSQMHIVRVFDQLIDNTDRNLHNVLIDKEWSIWMIDHTRAFRMSTGLRDAKNLGKCDRALLEKMKALDKTTLMKELGGYLTKLEIDGLLKRREAIVKIFEQKGPSALYESPRRTF